MKATTHLESIFGRYYVGISLVVLVDGKKSSPDDGEVHVCGSSYSGNCTCGLYEGP